MSPSYTEISKGVQRWVGRLQQAMVLDLDLKLDPPGQEWICILT
jgi:hypothetical protein